MVAIWAEQDVVVADEFRDGNCCEARLLMGRRSDRLMGASPRARDGARAR
jgi:hypothetical protein